MFAGDDRPPARKSLELAGSDVVRVTGDGLTEDAAEFGVAPGVLRSELFKETEQVVENLDLSVAGGAGPDADGGNPDIFGDHPADFGGHALENGRKCARRLDFARIFEQPCGILRGFAGLAVSARGHDMLREKSEVGDNGDAAADEFLDKGCDFGAALELDGVGACFGIRFGNGKIRKVRRDQSFGRRSLLAFAYKRNILLFFLVLLKLDIVCYSLNPLIFFWDFRN